MLRKRTRCSVALFFLFVLSQTGALIHSLGAHHQINAHGQIVDVHGDQESHHRPSDSSHDSHQEECKFIAAITNGKKLNSTVESPVFVQQLLTISHHWNNYQHTIRTEDIYRLSPSNSPPVPV